ncbi:MAG: BamA/TamA family outer membrane protein [Candidatus Competibacteraceae bacterium]|nr:BamA/TamA family outer membrane protein [Candidatus Competibacteraceae bacterium]
MKQIQIYFSIGILIAVLGLFSCSPTRRLHENEYLLTRNIIIQEGENKKEKDEIGEYVQQKPNTKVFGLFRFHLQVYNIPNPSRLTTRKERQREKIALKNDSIQAYNDRLPEGAKLKKLKKDKVLFGEWLQKIGEQPVILDSFKTEKSIHQLELYAKTKGFLRAEVRDSVVVKKKKAKVYYIINRGPAYQIDSITYDIPNPSLDYYHERSKSLLKKGMRYDMEILDKERDRLTQIYKDKGYYLFKKEFIRYEADTLQHPLRATIKLQVLDPNISYKDGDSIRTITEHRRFRISDIHVITNYQFGKTADQQQTITPVKSDYTFHYGEKLRYNHKILSRCIHFSRGGMYNLKDEEKTERAFFDLRNFKYINIRYVPRIDNKSENDWLDCYIELTPTARQSFGVDLQGTNTEGNLGVSIGTSYQNKNIFKGAEILDFRINAGLEIQVIQGDSTIIKDSKNPFNTIEIGAQLSLLMPRFLLPIRISSVPKWAKPKTRITFSFNYQQRPDYSRFISSFIFGYEWNQSINRTDVLIRHGYNPIELSLISINPDSSFSKYIDKIQDQFVRNSFRNHFILAGSYTFLFNNQQVSKFKDFIFFRFNAQLGGNLLNLISLVGKDVPIDDYHTVFGIRYAQFVRGEADFRYYKIFNIRHTLAFRFFAGVGLPFGNSKVLPFEKSFFIGGANDLRAWLPRTLGPGSFSGLDSGRVDQVGDIKLLTNIEYRFKIWRFLEAAVFADAGNIWLIRADNDRPNGEFRFDRFYEEFALGAGAGIRLNLGFFIFRLDLAIPLRDPTKPIGERWVVSKLKSDQLRINIGIGYPF